MMKRFRFNLFLSTIIIAAYLPMHAIADDASFKEQIYIQSVGGNYYHFDDSCSLTYWGNYHFLLNQTQKKSMNQGNNSELRPCPVCAASEYAAFYQNAADRYSPEEIARFKKLDEVNWLRSEGNLVPLEDLAELYPWMYTTPIKGDFPRATPHNTLYTRKQSGKIGERRKLIHHSQ